MPTLPKGSVPNSSARPFHKICMPIQNSRNAESRTMMVVPVEPMKSASRAEFRYETYTSSASSATAASVSRKNASKDAWNPCGRPAPMEMATEMVPGPVVSGMVKG